jgi:hypothetical protein
VSRRQPSEGGTSEQQLIANGVQVSDIDVQPWGSFVTVSDPDGNTWALQQIAAAAVERLPGTGTSQLQSHEGPLRSPASQARKSLIAA